MKYRMLLVLMGMGVVLLVGSSCPAQEKLPPPEPGPRTVPDTLPPAPAATPHGSPYLWTVSGRPLGRA